MFLQTIFEGVVFSWCKNWGKWTGCMEKNKETLLGNEGAEILCKFLGTCKCSVKAFTRALIEALNTAVDGSFRPSAAARRNSNSCSLTVSRKNTIASANCFLLVFFSDSHSNRCFSSASHFAFNCLQNKNKKFLYQLNKFIPKQGLELP